MMGNSFSFGTEFPLSAELIEEKLFINDTRRRKLVNKSINKFMLIWWLVRIELTPARVRAELSGREFLWKLELVVLKTLANSNHQSCR